MFSGVKIDSKVISAILFAGAVQLIHSHYTRVPKISDSVDAPPLHAVPRPRRVWQHL